MKNLLIILFLVFISVSSFSQKLNKLGKIVIDEIPQIPDHRIERANGICKILTDSFEFEGNSYYKIPNGFISSMEDVNDEKDYIKHYDSKGKLLVTIFSDRIINLKISENGNSLVFYNTSNIIHVNLNTYDIDTLSGSFIYSFIGSNDLIYYNSETKSIYFKGNRIEMDGYPNQFIDYKETVIVITKQNIFELSGNSLLVKYKFRGKFFDAKIINKEFYFVDRIEKRKIEEYTLYKTTDFLRFIIVDKLDDLNR